MKTTAVKPKSVAYLRVSTADQDNEKNKSDILKLANEKDLGQVKFIEEKISGKVPWRKRKVAGILEDLKQDDNLIISEFSRLGRSMLEIMEVLSISTEKGINIYSVKGNWQLNDSIQSKIIAMVFSMAAEIEREMISKRTREGLRARKAAGMKLGRPKGPGKSKLDPFRSEIEALTANGSTQRFVANRYNTTEANLSRWMKRHKIKRGSL